MRKLAPAVLICAVLAAPALGRIDGPREAGPVVTQNIEATTVVAALESESRKFLEEAEKTLKG